MKAYKHFILAILAIIGVLIPCAVEVNLNRVYVQESVEYTDLYIETAEHDVVEVAARMAVKVEKDEEDCSAVKIVKAKRKKHTSAILAHEKLRTYDFYGRQAGGLPAETNLLLAS